MKTMVYGVFDELEDARRVLTHLVGSPLDLHTITVTHKDAAVQEALRSGVGLPSRRTPTSAAVVGALLGAAVGAGLGTGALSALGPLVAAAMGAILGATGLILAAALADPSRLPRAVADGLLSEVEGGATVIAVRAGTLPTAHAIRDLFEAGGSRVLSDRGVPPANATDDANVANAVWRRPPLAADDVAGDPGDPGANAISQDHVLFAPPWRRTPFATRPPKGWGVETQDDDGGPVPTDSAARQSTDSAQQALGDEPPDGDVAPGTDAPAAP